MAKNRTQTRLPYYGYLTPFSLASLLLALATWSYPGQTIAQIVPDNTLPVNSTVIPSGNSFIIEGGTTAGSNLFHSFQQFSVPASMEAFFNNGGNIDNIISRITGDNISAIDGSLRSNGSANLIIINPNSLHFGAGASLNIGGSFLGSTANSVIFSDGSSFSATEANAPANATPLLTINVPAGLQFGDNPGAIVVRGTGHNLDARPPFFFPIERSDRDLGLRVLPGNTLAIVGGNVTIEGGILTAESGRIELGSVREGNVSLTPVTSGWQLDYSENGQFGSIELTSQALADVSGVGSGSIKARSAFLQLRDGSVLLNQNLGQALPANIEIDVSDRIELNGRSADGNIPSSIFSDALGGLGGDIMITTRRLALRDGASIGVTVNGLESGGNVAIDASESIELLGFSAINTLSSSLIGSITVNSGRAGNVDISTDRLRLEDGGGLGTVTFSSGDGGSLGIRANTIEVIGINLNATSPSAISSSTFGNGRSGNITIETGSLFVGDAGTVSASNVNSGNAGSITINATKVLEVSGRTVGSINPSQIEASAIIRDEVFRQGLGLPPVPEGNSGDVNINTPELQVNNGGLINVRNDGSGNSGSLSINANSILLDSGGGLTASTASGEGGNIIVNGNNALVLRRNSFIAAEAGGTGNGGNLTINAEVLAALENSDIAANAFEGVGGNIAINSASIFGTQFREAPTPNSDITASSQFGVSGTVTINNPEIDPSSGLVELPSAIGDRTDKVIVGCGVALGSSFIVTGRGGLPADPTAPIRGQTIWEDMRRFEDSIGGDRAFDDRAFDEVLSPRPPQAAMPNPQLAQPDARNSLSLVEATGWKVHPDGTVELIATKEDRNARHLGVPSTCNTESNYGSSQIDRRFLERSIPIVKLTLYSKDNRGVCCRPYVFIDYTYFNTFAKIKNVSNA